MTIRVQERWWYNLEFLNEDKVGKVEAVLYWQCSIGWCGGGGGGVVKTMVVRQ